jgi:hypothetical protein
LWKLLNVSIIIGLEPHIKLWGLLPSVNERLLFRKKNMKYIYSIHWKTFIVDLNEKLD